MWESARPPSTLNGVENDSRKRSRGSSTTKDSQLRRETETVDLKESHMEDIGKPMRDLGMLMEGSWDDNPEDVPLQAVSGTCSQFDLDGPVMVWAEGWPSWVFALRGVGISNVTFWIEHRRPALTTALRTLNVSESRCWTWPRAQAIAQNAARVFIQGSQQFVLEKMDAALLLGIPHQHVVAVQDVSLFGPVDDPIYEHATVLSHRQVGGITTGRWAVFASTIRDKELLNHRMQLKRSIGDVLGSTVGGVVSDPPHVLRRTTKRGSRGWHLPSDLLPVHEPEAMVIAPSVFSQTKHVHRQMTARELWDAYDVNTEDQARLPAREVKDAPVDYSFLFSTPIKVLHRVLISWLPLRMDAHTLGEPPPDIDPCDFSDDALPQHPNLLRWVPPGQEGSQSVAVKNDDAQADVNIWNIRAIGAFRPKTPVKNLVCDRIINEDVVTLFDGLRQLGFRRFQRNLTKSFGRYIKSTYGSNVLSPNSDFRIWQKEQQARPTSLSGGKRKRGQPSPPLSERDRRWTELKLDLEVGRDALRRGVESTWWEWTEGSTLFFWRWPPEYRKQARDGVRVFILSEKRLPRYWKKQRWPEGDEDQIRMMEKKLSKVRDNRKYLELGHVQSLTGFFAVPKGEDDIRMVYDATKCGLNDALWAPNFALPTVERLLNNASSSTWFGDIDLGEMFLNYPLDPRIRPYAGVDTYRNTAKGEKRGLAKRIFHRWTRNAMGLMSSPYNSTQSFAVGAEFIRGDLSDKVNPFGWDEVKLNLPGTPTYNPCLPWLYRWNSEREELPGFFSTYVDDIRTGGESEEACYRVTRRVASRTNYLGQQDAPRKRRKPSKAPGAWCGAIVVNLGEEGLFVTCSQAKWEKGRDHVRSLLDLVEQGEERLDRKDLESKRGFLIHLARTFHYINPYLKGIHLTMETFRPGRGESGWKWSRKAWVNFLSGELGRPLVKEEVEKEIKKHKGNHTPDTPPLTVKIAPRLRDDLRALWKLFSLETPPLRLVRGKSVWEAVYGFGDASGKGFGGSWEDRNKIHYRLGSWGSDGDGTSSNFRELKNLVQTLDEMGLKGHLTGREVFLFTDNSTAERAFYKGTSSSELLLLLVLEARMIEARHGCVIRLIHVSGKRMIAQGTDGLSRGNFNEGVMSGKSMLSFVPVSESATERSLTLKPWVEDWASGLTRKLEWLTPEDWYTRAHDIKGSQRNVDGHWFPAYQKGSYVWTPQPCVASFAVEQLREARHKRTKSLHIFLCPRIMTMYWEKELRKVADFIIDIPPGETFWTVDMYEPLTFALVLPFKSFYPWQHRGGKEVVALERELREMWKGDNPTTGPVLRKFFTETGLMGGM